MIFSLQLLAYLVGGMIFDLHKKLLKKVRHSSANIMVGNVPRDAFLWECNSTEAYGGILKDHPTSGEFIANYGLGGLPSCKIQYAFNFF